MGDLSFFSLFSLPVTTQVSCHKATKPPRL